ncbi:unnamed protein product [Kuraishia capsulata CBS 1993]|uniref:RRM domain-containing protein n=1 Tax=Kuraishia capsulata CBS 1993 TaxID=1382522 RepID=W6MU73_9ASCO|nr:uncharacterized protein KUCA_T00004912001 [Kuraishia capsulata CBS 1993]CDK28927.1 unnamed protein product [Kuraishia capsulata CBS 1993]
MSTTITASNIPLSVEDAKLQEFFSFCGKLRSITPLATDENSKTRSVKVAFESSSALSTALLLNGAELGGNAIKVESEEPAKSSEAHLEQFAPPPRAPPPGYSEADPKHEDGSDVPQELKPKAAILAQYLSSGYVVSDNIVNKAVEFDQKHGLTTGFKNFLSGLDGKYHIQEKNSQLYADADSKLKLDDKLSKGKTALETYVDKFKNDKYGSRVHDFYQGIVTDTKQVHEEAKRLADLKKESPSASASASASVEPETVPEKN